MLPRCDGDPLEIAPGISKIIRELNIWSYTNNEGGQMSSWNDGAN